MAKLDYKKMAAGLKLSSEKDKPDEDDKPDDEEGGSLGEKVLSAISSKNAEALEEAIRQIAG